ncbi:GCN5 family acetyltransferase [Gordoniibacillus kamchatkensis]|uniref:GCN5 family acetyltransferase n=1 Tax=Gordoniibacillus kamchatkensis TaxID=1590651 RepID=A0ABR5AKV3_9BACL|nr:GNAT family protein [Paenibacillus sp. VKM B-2647]KIL41542.1 GCN5 family acetyltransferase [Paenibacillus sp. VKM B-2647]
MKLQTARLEIRDFVPNDAADVHRYASDPQVTAYMIWGPNTEQETADFIVRAIGMQRRQPRLDYELALTLRESGRLIGGCGIHVSEPEQGEIGYCIDRAHWRQGYASEAAAALLRFGFEELGLHRIYATCRPGNIGSAAVMKKIGMTYEGHMREHMRHKGGWHDSYQYSILRREYMKGQMK